jgi:pyruvate,water dikinase
MPDKESYIRWFSEIRKDDVDVVGGKNASLGEMVSNLKENGIRVPNGFATTGDAYWSFLEANEIRERLKQLLDEQSEGKNSLARAGKAIRRLFLRSEFPELVAKDIREAYRKLCGEYESDDVDVAVRSSATAEDLPGASFAGQQETFLNVTGEEDLLEACLKCYASLFTDRAISYRNEKGFDHMNVALSVGVQKMIRSDQACSGVMFSLDTETGFPNVVLINSSWGLGENIVQGMVTPDEFMTFKPLLGKDGFTPIIGKVLGDKEKKRIYAPGVGAGTKNINTPTDERRSFSLSDEEVLELSSWAVAIEKHYGCPMDIEWAKDGGTGDLYVLQARPETVQSRKETTSLKTYTLKEKGRRILKGIAIGQAVAAGKACVIKDIDRIDEFEDGCILVTAMTDPDWVPIMKRAAGIVTDYGGRTCHAAIVSRELGIPAVVGTGEATEKLKDDGEITLSCAEGDEGHVYEGILDYDEELVSLEDLPETETRIMMNIASPGAAFRWWRLPCKGVGLARMEFIVNNVIKIHPLALVHFDDLEDPDAKRQIEKITHGYEDKTEYFVDLLARGISKIAASQYPEPVIVRMSDFKTNEYADLIGGRAFEPDEANPMLGFRGASRYYSDEYRDGFALECRAIKRVRETIGLTNVLIMIPFCRTPKEADRVLEVLGENGLRRGENGLEVYVMCEIPSNVILAAEFADRFDGFSIGSNDLTQLVLGVDRDSSRLADIFDERDEAVGRMVSEVIKAAHRAGRKVGICGQAPSDYPEFAAFLVEQGIDSISLNPDSVVRVVERVAEAERSKSAVAAGTGR